MGYIYDNIHTGDRFGDWIILDENDFEQKNRYRKFKCQCQCINKTIKYVDERNLKNGASICCGNCTFKNIESGDKFYEWTVIDNKKIKGKVLCKCSCGTEKMVNSTNLQTGKTMSCGCIQLNNHFKINQYTNSGEEIIIGNIYNKWTVLEQVKSQSYLCECSCMHHTIQTLKRSELLGSNRLGCKKCRLMIDVIGQTFGYLTILNYDEEKTKEKGRVFVKAKCKCGTEFTVEQNSITRGRTSSCGCKKSEFNTDLIGRRFGYLVVTNLIGRKYTDDKAKSTIEWECRCDCGNVTIVRQGNLLSGSTFSCGCMKRSHGEYMIYKYLSKHKFEFIEQYRIEDCRNILPLPFDFALFSNKNLLGLIEFDGRQHFEPFAFNNCDKDEAYKNFKKCVKRDLIKINYCKTNNIKLLTLTYKDLESGDWIYMLWDFLYELNLIVDIDKYA